MDPFRLSGRDRSRLERLVATTDRARLLRRAQALLWLDDGERPTDIARRCGVSRQSLYNWAARFLGRAGSKLAHRLDDAPRSGRPCTALGIIDPLLQGVLGEDPRAHGYPAPAWTAPLLRHYLGHVHGITVSADSVRDAIARGCFRWKRPRHRLALRPEHWRQAKGA
jgi:transposase